MSKKHKKTNKAPKAAPVPAKRGLIITPGMVAAARLSRPRLAERVEAFRELFPIPVPPPGVPNATELREQIAMDMAPHYEHAMDWGGGAGAPALGWAWGSAAAYEGIGFFGYPYLAELTQRAEYRMISEIRAEEMTRKWIELTYKGGKDETKRLDKLNAWFDRHKVRDKFRVMAENDGFFGRSHLYIDTGATDRPAELKTRLPRIPQKIKKGSIEALRVVEPLWTYPNRYNASDPLKPDYFKPQTWFVMGKLVNATRMFTMVSRPMPDLLKAAYAFGGLSLSQMAKPYVDNWLNTRQAVADLVKAFSTMILATDMESQLSPDSAANLNNRLDLFNAYRNNFGTMITNKESEELTAINTPLGTLDQLQAQAQEHMASVARTPLVKLLGITPSGLNASSDGEIRAYYDGIKALQEKLFRDPITDLLTIAQLDIFGDVDPGVGLDFVSLWELDEAGQALVRKTNADTAAILIESGTISNEEDRKRVANDPGSPYAGLDVEDMPVQPDLDGESEPVSASGDPAKGAEPRKEERSGV